MKNIIFKKIGMENYCCFKNPFELEIENNKLVLVTGSNGKGKTSAVECIPYTLYGVNSKGQKGPDVVNDEIGKNCFAWNEFTVNETQYRIERYYAHSKHQNNVYLYKNNELFKKGQNEIKSIIEKLLIPAKLCTNTILFGQKVKNFFSDLQDTEQKEIFRKILNLDMYETWKDLIDKELKKDIEINISLEKQLGILLSSINISKDNIEKLNNKLEEFEKNKVEKLLNFSTLGKQLSLELNKLKENFNIELITLYEQEYMNLNKEFVNKENEIKNINSKLEKYKIELQNKIRKEIQEYSDNYNDQINNLNKDNYELVNKKRTELDNIKEQFNININNIKNEVQQLKIIQANNNSKINELSNNIKKFSNLKNEQENNICPECKQSINNDIVKQFEKQLNDDKLEYSNLTEIYNTINKDINIKNENIYNLVLDLNNKIKILTSEIDNINTDTNNKINDIKLLIEKFKNDKIEEVIIDYNNEKNNINIQIEKYKIENLKLQTDINNKKLELDNLKNIEKNINKYESDLSNLRDRFKDCKQQEFDKSLIDDQHLKLENLNKELEIIQYNINTIKNRIEIGQFWKEGCSQSGIPSILIDEAIPFMNNKISEYLNEISNGRYTVTFDTLKTTKSGEFRDKISVNVYDGITKANSKNKFSGGQIRLIDIAIILTLYDLQCNYQKINFNLMILDEVFDAIDEENIGYVNKLLRKKTKDKSIYIISHKHVDSIEPDLILKF